MKYLFTLYIILICFYSANSQVRFSYDQSGNRIKSVIEVVLISNSSLSSTLPASGEKKQDASLEKVKVYPNPIYEEVNIDFMNGFISPITIYDLEGKVVLSTTPASDRNAIDLSALKSGCYILELTKEPARKWKILKQ